ncbi:hypothetical protein DEA8626_01189 [Defluviimonas aquaemixtae]|uniref:DUF2214 domain-containing protein n=1 Tax=Albidovulum aquaemixtae TaxID=1542388 RepID=A0A2R8B4X7_9RHOB|nr:hypothetical protein [Defluviimonas aquaemixtae]SPH17665.1 hypothetical protein DEA8626_01189 [Defluviimonas aquaemixtae]
MNEIAASLEATELAHFLKASRWVYPLVNAGHILGIALLVGAVVPMDLRILAIIRRPALPETIALLRPVAVAGLVLAATCGGLLFITQATDYVGNDWFWAKITLVALATANALVHRPLLRLSEFRRVTAATISLTFWPAALICGRMIGYS